MDCRRKQSNVYKLAVLVICLSLVMTLAGLLSRQSASAMPVMQASKTPKPTGTLTPTPTRTLKPPDLNSQAVFSIAGGPAPTCLEPEDNSLGVAYSYASIATSSDHICLYGFPQHEQVTINIYDPGNRLVATIPYIIQNLEWAQNQGYALSIVTLMPLPLYAPTGWWRIQVDRPGTDVEAGFNQPGSSQDISLSKSVSPQVPWYDSRRTKNMIAGETLRVDGANFPKNQEFPVAIYRYTHPNLSLVTAQNVRTDQKGRFSAGFLIDGKFPPGGYYVKVAPVPGQESLGVPFIKNIFEVIKPQQVCPGAQPSRLVKDDMIIVSSGTPNNVREKPGVNSRLEGKFFPYEALEYLAGPKCADGLVWWKVYSLNTGLDGWTAEGQGGDTWINSLRR